MKSLILAVILSSPIAKPATTPEWTDAAAKKAQDQVLKLFDLGRKKDYPKVILLGERLAKNDPHPLPLLVLAEAYDYTNRPDKAMATLEMAVKHASGDLSFRLGEEIENDPDLQKVRKHPQFRALLARAYASQWKPTPIAWGTKSELRPNFRRSGPENPYLTELRTKYNLDALVAGSRGDLERVKIICTWVHTRWNHVGMAERQPTDPIGLLDAAGKGDNFRCVEYGITAAGCLAALGIPARVVGARAKDVETRLFGAGHVFAEAYLRDRKRWVFLDPQMNVVGEVNGQPANTVEFRNAMAAPHSKVSYEPTLGSCFYYFTFGRDERFPESSRTKGSYWLVPKGSPVPKKFQRMNLAPPLAVTHNPADIYRAPGEVE